VKLFEFEAKDLFEEVGIPLEKERKIIYYPEELISKKLNYPAALKTQVLDGKRGIAGGIKFADNLEEAIQKSKEIFDLEIKGEKPSKILIEPKVKIKKEFYLSITLDRENKCPILLGSSEGGMEIESSLNIKKVLCTQEYSPALGRKLCYLMNLKNQEFKIFSQIINKIYDLYLRYDLDLIEINPLAQLENGSIVALDGKISINENSLERQPRFANQKIEHLSDLSEREKKASMVGLNLVELGEGNIGILCNGAGLTMATMDLVRFKGGKPANFLDIGGGADKNKVNAALKLVTDNPEVNTLFINILGGITSCDQVAIPLVDFKKNFPNHNLVVRLLGNNQELAKKMLQGTGIEFVDNLSQAVESAIKIAN